MPTSVTVHGDVVVVLNEGGAANLAAFRLARNGILWPTEGGTAAVHGTGSAEVLFDDHGELLVVSNKTSNTIDVFEYEDGAIRFLYTAAAAGETPYGFAFAHNDVTVVSEAGTGSASSYKLSETGLTAVSAAVSDSQAAPCWLTVTNNGAFAYVANAQSSSVSLYSVAADGSLKLVEAAAGRSPGGATDLALSRNSSYLYLLARGTVTTFGVRKDTGALTNLGVAIGMPATLTGLAAR